ncbi:MAG: sulfatase-like hydrolase/transferase [Candidatus Azotimanducaceae bacterium WSBS_2022_MAG_OTU7]
MTANRFSRTCCSKRSTCRYRQLAEYIDRYRGVYDNGCGRAYVKRLARAVDIALLPETVPMVRMASTGAWDALSDERKRYESKRMAVYAGMIEAMDHHIGRLLAYLRERGELDNTIFIFTSDNGAEGSGPIDPLVGLSSVMTASMGYSTDYETLGLKGSYNSIGPGFTSAAVSPLAFYKFYTGEGGLRVPLIVSGRPLGDMPKQTTAFAWATDIAATILSFASVDLPGERYGGQPVLPVTGLDLTPLVRGETDRAHGEDAAIGYELTGQAALFKGDFKVVRNLPPLGDGQWRLYNIVGDPGETADLASKQPARLNAMLSAYETFRRENKVQPIPPGYSRSKQIVLNLQRDRLGPGVVLGLLTLLVLLPFGVYMRMKRKR